MKKILLYSSLALLLPASLFGQKAWITPNPINPNDSVTIYVDIKACDCQRLLGSTEPLYMWTWQPADPVIGNGDWTASNPDMAMKNEGDDVWSKTFIPTEFYGVDGTTIFENDFSFLVKASDGSGLGGGGCDEDKTEDLMILVDPPVTGPRKVYSFPDIISPEKEIAITPNEVFSLVYDNKLEEKPTMQDNVLDLYVYARATTSSGAQIRVANLPQVDETPALKMTELAEKLYRFTIIPNLLFENVLPAGDSLVSMRFQIVQDGFRNTDQTVDGEFLYVFSCD